MLAEDELRELAADIKQRGQLQPIVLDTDGRILDGRNRYAACELVGVEPEFETYEGDDPGGYALSVNVNRREMTKGQKAMVIVEASGYTEYNREHAKTHGVSQQYVSRARIVREYVRPSRARAAPSTTHESPHRTAGAPRSGRLPGKAIRQLRSLPQLRLRTRTLTPCSLIGVVRGPHLRIE
jgi:hypothetical protein